MHVYVIHIIFTLQIRGTHKSCVTSDTTKGAPDGGESAHVQARNNSFESIYRLEYSNQH